MAWDIIDNDQITKFKVQLYTHTYTYMLDHHKYKKIMFIEQ